MTITHPSHNSTEELLHPNVIKVALPRPLNTMGQNACTLERWSNTTTLPASKTRQKDTKTEIRVHIAHSKLVTALD